MRPDEGAYYATRGRISDAGARAMLLSAMPSDPERLVAAVSMLILHRLFIVPLGTTPHPASGDDVESRMIARMLDRISGAPSPDSTCRGHPSGGSSGSAEAMLCSRGGAPHYSAPQLIGCSSLTVTVGRRTLLGRLRRRMLSGHG